MNIGLDFDGVIADSVSLKALTTKILYGVDIAATEFTSEVFINEKHLTQRDYDNLCDVIYNNPKIGMMLKPVSDAMANIKKLLADGHEVKVITSREKSGVALAQKWLDNYDLKLKFVGVGQGMSKVDMARGLDIYIDDDNRKLTQLIGVVPQLILFSWHYNQNEEIGDGIEKVNSWEELCKKIDGLL